MKHSKQRDALLRILRSTRSHPTADWLYAELRKEFPNISLGTVYRNLALLAENGTILKLQTGSNKEHFDGFTDRHFHFVCRECGSIYDVALPSADRLNAEAEAETGAEVESCSLVFYGVCSVCKEGV